jgi:hypothetical protein
LSVGITTLTRGIADSNAWDSTLICFLSPPAALLKRARRITAWRCCGNG